MKTGAGYVFACLLMLLGGCNNGEHASAGMDGKMQPLQQLATQAILTAAHAADLQMEQDTTLNKQGQMMLSQSTAMLRRAMSGPEMSAMHSGGMGASPGMKRMHDLGDSAFDLLELMMKLTPGQRDAAAVHRLNMQLAIAAGAALVQYDAGRKQLSPELQQLQLKHAATLKQSVAKAIAAEQAQGEYAVLVKRLLGLLDL